jgi:hypothetical protein
MDHGPSAGRLTVVKAFMATYYITAVVLRIAIALFDIGMHASWLSQCIGLVGSRGLAPADKLPRISRGFFQHTPVTDAKLRALCYAGIAFGVAALFDFPFFPAWLGLAGSLATYYSLRACAGRFMGLQMHTVPLELNFWYALAALSGNQHAWALIAQTFAFRLMMGGGLGKVTGGDDSWLDLTAMKWHYFTMPLPNRFSPYFHRLPMWAHKLEGMGTLLVEGPLAIGYLTPFTSLRALSCFGTASMLFAINVSGNFGALWLSSMTGAVGALDDSVWSFVLPTSWSASIIEHATKATGDNSFFSLGYALAITWPLYLAGYALAAYYFAVQTVPLRDTIRPYGPKWIHEYVAKPFDRLMASTPQLTNLWATLQRHYLAFERHSVLGSYVKFAHMTKFRNEIILEARDAASGEWHEIAFKYKPSNLDRALPFVPPCHLPSLDWMLWFIPLQIDRVGGATSFASTALVPAWVTRLVEAVREQEPTVMALLAKEQHFTRSNPPDRVRAVLYPYTFADGATGGPGSWKRGECGGTLVETTSEPLAKAAVLNREELLMRRATMGHSG